MSGCGAYVGMWVAGVMLVQIWQGCKAVVDEDAYGTATAIACCWGVLLLLRAAGAVSSQHWALHALPHAPSHH
jgi:hypothetical protein